MMEGDLIIKYLEKEIRYHDCLIIPGFGGFIGSYESAYFDRSQGKYFPPSKALIFNTNLQNNDGLLANLIKDGEGISYVSALSIIENTVAFWQKQVEEGQRIEIADFGYIYKTRLGHIQFYQNKAINLYPGSYGLTAVTATGAKLAEVITPKVVEEEVHNSETTAKEEKKIVIKGQAQKREKPIAPVINLSKSEKIEEESEVNEDDHVLEYPATRKFRIPRKYLVAASFVPFLFYSYWIPAQTDFLKTGKIQVSDFNPFVKPSKAKYAPRATFLSEHKEEEFISVEQYLKTLPPDTKTFSYPFDEDCFIPVKLEGNSPLLENLRKDEMVEEAVQDENVIEPELKNEVVQPTATGNYHIIAGCFGEKANADNLVQTIHQKGYQAVILDQHKGLYRVSASGFNSKSEALEARAKMKADGISGWILKK